MVQTLKTTLWNVILTNKPLLNTLIRCLIEKTVFPRTGWTPTQTNSPFDPPLPIWIHWTAKNFRSVTFVSRITRDWRNKMLENAILNNVFFLSVFINFAWALLKQSSRAPSRSGLHVRCGSCENGGRRTGRNVYENNTQETGFCMKNPLGRPQSSSACRTGPPPPPTTTTCVPVGGDSPCGADGGSASVAPPPASRRNSERPPKTGRVSVTRHRGSAVTTRRVSDNNNVVAISLATACHRVLPPPQCPLPHRTADRRPHDHRQCFQTRRFSEFRYASSEYW